MSNFAFQRTAVDESGNVIPDAEVEVRDQDGVLAALFDESGASLLNPLSADAEGFFRFYVAIGRYDITVRGDGRELTWLDVQIGVPEDRPLLRAPEITSPQDLALDVALNFELEGSPYAPLYEADLRQYRQFQVTPLSGELSNPEFDVQENADTATIGTLDPSEQYQARIRDVSINGDQSPWSPVISFTSTGVFVVTPTNVEPNDDATDESLTPTLESSAFETEGSADVHESSRWRVFDNGGVLVYDSGNVTSSLTSFELPQSLEKDTTYTWQVRHIGESLGASQYSDPTSFTTTDAEIQTPTITVEGSPDGVPENPVITGSAFTMTQGTDTHESTDWSVRETATGTVVYDSLGDAVNLESIQVPAGVLDELTEYDFEARYNGAFISSDYGVATATTIADFPALPPFMAVSHIDSPYITVYNQVIDEFEKLPDPSTLPTDTGRDVAFSSDDTYMAVAHASSPYITIYKRSGDTFTKLSDPSDLPTGTGWGVAFSSDDTYMAVAHDSSPFITIYKRNGDTFTKLPDPATLPTARGYAVAFSSDDTYMAVSHSASPYINIYKRSGDTFTKLADPSDLPAGTGYAVAFSSDDTYMAVAHSASPYINIYKRSGDTFTKLPDPATLPPDRGYAVAFSSDDTYMVVGHSVSPYIAIYKRNGDTFTKLSDPATLPTNQVADAVFSSDDTYMAVAQNSSPYIAIYKRSGDTFTKLPDPTTLPPSSGWGIAFSNTGYPQL